MRVSFILTSILPVLLLTAAAAESGVISGRMLLKNGTPMSGGIAVAFDMERVLPPVFEKYLQPPNYMEDIEKDGSFRMELPEGKYYIGAIKRKDGMPGPPLPGDDFFILSDEKLNAKLVEVPENGQMEFGNLAAGEVFSPVSDPLHTYTSVSGRVMDDEKKPVKNITVAAVLVRKGKKDMLFLALGTDSNGKYTLKLPFGGVYNLGIMATGPDDDNVGKDFNMIIQVETGDTLQEVDLRFSQIR